MDNKKMRSICIICGKKGYRQDMFATGRSWLCRACALDQGKEPDAGIKVLNLYAGIGGNRKLWPPLFKVTAIELNVKVAAEYKRLYPSDRVIVADAHTYLLKNYGKFNFIWSSPPCQTHSRMNYWIPAHKKRYPDLSLFQEIIFLRTFCGCPWVVENVKGYYTTLISPNATVGRNIFWSNFTINEFVPPTFPDFIDSGKKTSIEPLMQWLGFDHNPKIYLSSKDNGQVFRNCVHPLVGHSIIKDAFNL